MKLAMMVLAGALVAALAACQSDVTGPPMTAGSVAVENSPDNMHRDVERGDIFLEENLDRYDLTRN